jgi:hypothetical protein
MRSYALIDPPEFPVSRPLSLLRRPGPPPRLYPCEPPAMRAKAVSKSSIHAGASTLWPAAAAV